MRGKIEWTPRDVVSAKYCQKEGGAFKSEAAKKLLSTAASLGFGTIVSAGKSKFIFKRKAVEDLNDHCKKLVKLD